MSLETEKKVHVGRKIGNFVSLFSVIDGVLIVSIGSVGGVKVCRKGVRESP